MIAPRLGRPTALAVSPDGRTLALGFPGGQVTLRDIRDGKETELQPRPRRPFGVWPSRRAGGWPSATSRACA